MNSLLRETEKNIFDGQESKMVITISNINRTLIDFRQALRFHKEALNQFEFVAKKFFGENFSYYLSSIISEYSKTQDILDSHKEILDDLRDTNDSLLASKSTQTITLLTLITFLTSPIILISSIFVMDTSFIKHEPREFYSIIGVMIALSILAFIYSKYKKWL
jgi:Mg2+ and Co2+ transporter CorA